MRCYRCNTIVDGETHCPHCGTDITIYRRIVYTSNAYYNEGLRRAKVKDISGAIEVLQLALQLDKYNMKARNLLGLCYFEIGEVVAALSEWVISKNLDPNDANSSRYLDYLQNQSSTLKRANETIKKYNQALIYCQQGSRDLATIQLKRVIADNPKLVVAYQLLALLYIQERKFEEAKKTLNQAAKLDLKNTTTLRYMDEVKEQLKLVEVEKKKERREAMSLSENSDVIMPNNTSFYESVTASRGSFINIMTGLILGLLVCFFLVVPTVKQNAINDAANALVDADQELSTTGNSISSLQSEVEKLKEELSKYDGTGDSATAYEKLLEANAALAAGNRDLATTNILLVDKTVLSKNGQDIYNNLVSNLGSEILINVFEAGTIAYDSGDFDTAVEKLNTVVETNPSYGNGEAMYKLADSYRQLKKNKLANQTFTKLIEVAPQSGYAAIAKEYLGGNDKIFEQIESGLFGQKAEGQD